MLRYISIYTILILSTLWGMPVWLNAQSKTSGATYTISGQVLEAGTTQPIPYASVYNYRNGKGALTNVEGYFVLAEVAEGDSVVISFIGFQSYRVQEPSNFVNIQVGLVPKVEMLKEAQVIADSGFLYDMVAKCRKSQRTGTRSAKSYFMHQSTVNNQTVELLESYYTGEYANYDVQELKLKNGRIALRKFHQRFFVSTETSKAIYLHRLFQSNKHFPLSPLELSRRKLRKTYQLSLISKYRDERRPVYVIDFLPHANDGTSFGGRLWVDSLSNAVLKIALKLQNAQIHPFVPMGNAESIEGVDLEITKSYDLKDGIPRFNSLDFNYNIIYRARDTSYITVHSSAILYAYDYQHQFSLPHFEYSRASYQDYRMINANPYNHFFWEEMDEFKLQGFSHKYDQLLRQADVIDSRNFFQSNLYFKKGFFESPYVFWSPDRVHFIEAKGDAHAYPSLLSRLPSERYNLEAQIYLDINKLGDSVHFLTQSVFDPFKSYYHFPPSREGDAFVNIYFDLIEVYRRKLDERLKNLRDESMMKAAYEKLIEEKNLMLKDFFKDVQHGTHRPGMLQWNEYIYRELGIDNMAIFGLYQLDSPSQARP